MTGLYERGTEGRFEKGHVDDREHDEHEDREGVAPDETTLVGEDHTEATE